MKSHLPHRWQKLPAFATAITVSVALATGEEAPDFFDIIGKSPAEVATSVSSQSPLGGTEFLMSAFVGVPMSGEHRQAFMDGLQAIPEEPTPSKRYAILCQVNLLEEDSRLEDALSLLTKELPNWHPSLVRQVGLLWKSGKIAEATTLAQQITDSQSLEEYWLSLVGIDLCKGREEEAMRLVAFLENLDSLRPQVRHALAMQHLVFARHEGKVEDLVATTASPVLRAVWHTALDRKPQALACIEEAGPGLKAGEIGMLAVALPKEAIVFERAKALLNTTTLPVGDLRSLLLCFSDLQQRFDLWSAMKSGHGETADLFSSIELLAGSDSTGTIRQACLEKAKDNPHDLNLKWLAVLSNFGKPDEAALKEIVRFVREQPLTGTPFADPARLALEKLVKTSPPEELRALLLQAPGFEELPAHAKIRYLVAADLDIDVVATCKSCTFDKPEEDHLASTLAYYFKRRAYAHEIPDELTVFLIDRLPQLVVASPSKQIFARSQDANLWLTFLGNQLVKEDRLADAVRRLLDTGAALGEEARRSLATSLPEFAWSLPGFENQRPKKPSPQASIELPIYNVLSAFAPPNLTRIGQGDPIGAAQNGLDYSFVSRIGEGAVYLTNSPWTENLRGLQDSRYFDPALQAKLRPLFEKQPSRTIIYDLLVASGKIECPDAAVKVAAEQRAATLVPAREDDPAIAVFSFFQRLSKGVAVEQCQSLLDGIGDFPKTVRLRVSFRPSPSSQRFSGAAEVLRKKLGFELPPQPPQAPSPPGAYDRLQFFIEARRESSPEAIDLAKSVLSSFADSGRAQLGSDENISIKTLSSAGKFSEFLDELTSRMKNGGQTELEIQRALFRLHRYWIVHSKGEAVPFAKRILELDPDDAQAAVEVLDAAIRDGDPELAVKCLGILCRRSRPLLLAALDHRDRSSGNQDSTKLFALFKGAKARELSEALLRNPFPKDEKPSGYHSYNEPTLEPLYHHTAIHDPENLKPLLHWSGALTPGNAGNLVSLANELKRQQREPAALDLLAEAFFNPIVPLAESPLRFRPKSPEILPPSFPLVSIAQSSWLMPLAEIAAGSTDTNARAGTSLLIALAANPQPETWDKLVPRFLSGVPLATRPEVRRELVGYMKMIPQSAALQLYLAKDGDVASPTTLSAIRQKLYLAKEADDRTQVAGLWTAAKALMTKAREPERLEFLKGIANALACLADDTSWNEFLELAGKTNGFAPAWFRESGVSIPPSRLADLTHLLLPSIKQEEGMADRLLGLFVPLATADTPDLKLLQEFRPWMEIASRRPFGPPQLVASQQWLDLLAEDAVAACPVVDARLSPDGSYSIDWSLAAFKGNRSGFPSGRAFPFLDGQFDIDFLAGPAPERLSVISSIARAPATGRTTVKLPGDAKFLSALVRQAPGSIVRWSHPLDLSSDLGFEPVPLVPVADGNPDKKIPGTLLPAGGPFLTGDATDFQLPAGTGIELARWVWDGGPPPQVSGWLLAPDSPGALALSFRTAGDKEISTQAFPVSDDRLDTLPFWRRFRTSPDLKVPAETESIVLVFKGDYSKRPVGFRIADVRSVPLAQVVLPDGFTSLGRIPGAVEQIALDTQANRIAVSSRGSNVGIFDFATNEFSGWIPLDKSGSLDIVWMALAGDHVVALKRTGELYLASVSRRQSKMIRKTDDLTRFGTNSLRIALSSDGNFIAWGGIMAGLRIAKLGDEGIATERILETPQLRFLQFNSEQRTIEAQADDNAYVLKLEDWNTAGLTVTRLADRDYKILQSANDNPGQRWKDVFHDLVFEVTPYETSPVEVHAGSRSVKLPAGLVDGDREGKPFFISNYGRVMRIEPARMKGYTPPLPK